jgi:hypothetical protein
MDISLMPYIIPDVGNIERLSENLDQRLPEYATASQRSSGGMMKQ